MEVLRAVYVSGNSTAIRGPTSFWARRYTEVDKTAEKHSPQSRADSPIFTYAHFISKLTRPKIMPCQAGLSFTLRLFAKKVNN